MVLKNVPNGLQIAPSTAFSEIGRTSGKDRQRYALYLTVFGFTAGAHLKKTGRNIVKSSSYGKRERLTSQKSIIINVLRDIASELTM
jgi:phage terminase small subunit